MRTVSPAKFNVKVREVKEKEITIWYEKLAAPLTNVWEDQVHVDTADPGISVFYHSDRNLIINKICKNGTSSVEALAPHCGFIEIPLYSTGLFFCPEKPTVITILRDPIERFISAANMYVDQLKSMGLRITPENFTNLEYATDMHFRLQVGDVLCNWVDEGLGFNRTNNVLTVNGMVVYNGVTYERWSDFINSYPWENYIEHDKQKFYLMEHHTDVIQQIANDFDLDIPVNVGTRQNASTEELRVLTMENMSPELLQYITNFYQPDYRLLDLVKFENKDTP